MYGLKSVRENLAGVGNCTAVPTRRIGLNDRFGRPGSPLCRPLRDSIYVKSYPALPCRATGCPVPSGLIASSDLRFSSTPLKSSSLVPRGGIGVRLATRLKIVKSENEITCGEPPCLPFVQCCLVIVMQGP
jgi:hypothetical protein